MSHWNFGHLRSEQTCKVSLAQFSVYEGNKVCQPFSNSHGDDIPKECDCQVTCPWKRDSNAWALFSDESESRHVQNFNLGLSMYLYKREWSWMLARFQKKKTGFSFSAYALRKERERQRRVLLWGIGGRKPCPCCFPFVCWWHIITQRAGVAIDMLIRPCVLCQASVVVLHLYGKRKINFT